MLNDELERFKEMYCQEHLQEYIMAQSCNGTIIADAYDSDNSDVEDNVMRALSNTVKLIFMT